MYYSFKPSQKIDLELTLYCGQIFSFRKVNNEHIGVIEGILFYLKQSDDTILYKTEDEISKELAEDILANFFTLDINYNELITLWNNSNVFQFKITGLRLLRLDLVETIFSFICSANNNIKRITAMVDYLSSKGEFIREINGNKFYRFPMADKLVDIEEELVKNKFGYRAKYICATAKKLSNMNLEEIKTLEYNKALELLLKLNGIGRKVADCICLMGLSHFNAIPVDVHIFRTAQSLFKIKMENLNKTNYEKIVSLYKNSFIKYIGIAQLFIFFGSLNKKGSSTNKIAV